MERIRTEVEKVELMKTEEGVQKKERRKEEEEG